MEEVKTAIIGGTGLYDIEGIEIIESIDVDTPFGNPSDSIRIARVGDNKAAFLPRHGTGHRILPTEIPVKANIWALKKLGIERIISISAVGSLKDEIRPRDIVVPDQIIDRTKSRVNSFFGNGIVGHVSFAEPFCGELVDIIYNEVTRLGYRVHRGGTYVCMEGPVFSTRAESNLYRSWGGGVIGMTAVPEAKLAREAEICYAVMALSTDYDCWKDDGQDVTIEIVVENLKANVKAASDFVKSVLGKIPAERTCSCGDAARYAIITGKDHIPEKVRKDLSVFYGKYWE
jgi:5'-methylthioadenosine phosphorylase